MDKNLTDVYGDPSAVQASSALGSGLGVTFASVSPLPGVAGAPNVVSLYLGSFVGGGWSTQGLFPQAEPGPESDEVLGWSGDLSRTVVGAEEPVLTREPVVIENEGSVEGSVEAGVGQKNYYVRSDTTPVSYRLLAPGPGKVIFAAATLDGSHILFEDDQKLTANAAGPGCEGNSKCPNGVFNLYEWHDGRVSLAGVLEDDLAPVEGSVPGAGGPLIRAERGVEHPGGFSDEFYTQETLSGDGRRVFFSDPETGIVYMREDGVSTVQVSGGALPAYWRAATPDGGFVFYTEGKELYRFNVKRFEESEKPEPEALAEAREQLTSGAEGVAGMLGVSRDGSYAYFVASGVLTGVNDEGHSPAPGERNLYEWHDGVFTFVATLSAGGYELYDWSTFSTLSAANGPAGGEKSAQVSPAGTSVLFSSVNSLTDYAHTGESELYLFDAAGGGALRCVSCNPTGAPAMGEASWETRTGVPEVAAVYPFLTNNLSADGDHVFFQTKDSLVSTDKNGVSDVYEWEREGSGGCAVGGGEDGGGCLYLISTGQSSDPSYFGDASVTGSDVFFFTRQPLVGQDQDLNQDLYDARENGGLNAQTPVLKAACSGEECRGEPVAPPQLSTSSSAMFSGPGNPAVSLETAPVGAPKVRPMTRTQKLARALAACRKQSGSRKKRVACEARAHKRYGGKAARSLGARRADLGGRS